MPTTERFRDPASRLIVRVWIDPAETAVLTCLRCRGGNAAIGLDEVAAVIAALTATS